MYNMFIRTMKYLYLYYSDWILWASWSHVSHGEISHIFWVHQLERFYRSGRVQQESDDFSVSVYCVRPSATRPQSVGILWSSAIGVPYVSVWNVFWIVHAFLNGAYSCWCYIH